MELGLELFDDLAAVEAPWRELGERSGNLFSTWEWAQLWWDEHGGGRPLVIGLCRDDAGEAAAILPLFLDDSGEARVLRFVGSRSSDELGPVCAPERRPAAAHALLRVLARAPVEWDAFVGEDMPGGFPWASELEGRELRRLASPEVAIDGRSWDELLESRSANFRAQVRRRERRLASGHSVEWRTTETGEELDADIAHLFRLHEARWPEGTRFASRDRSLKRRFAAAALDRGWLRLRILELDGRPAAALLDYRFGEAELFYQGGRDPAYESEGVGSALMARAIRAAAEEGAKRFRLLRGGEAYKYRWADSDPGVVTVHVTRGT